MKPSTDMPAFPDPALWPCVVARLGLSAREAAISLQILSDKKELAIADDLGISAHTVHTHLERLYRKLGVSSRVGLAVALLGAQSDVSHAQICLRDCPRRMRPV